MHIGCSGSGIRHLPIWPRSTARRPVVDMAVSGKQRDQWRSTPLRSIPFFRQSPTSAKRTVYCAHRFQLFKMRRGTPAPLKEGCMSLTMSPAHHHCLKPVGCQGNSQSFTDAGGVSPRSMDRNKGRGTSKRRGVVAPPSGPCWSKLRPSADSSTTAGNTDDTFKGCRPSPVRKPAPTLLKRSSV